MNDTRIDAWLVLLLTTFIFLMLTCTGCSTTAHSNKEYLDSYVKNAIEYSANKDKEILMQMERDWNMYLKTRWTGK